MNLHQNIKDLVFKALEVFDKSEIADHGPAEKSFLELIKASEDPQFNQEDIIKQIKIKKDSISSKICSHKTSVAKSGLSFTSALAKSLKQDFKPFIHLFVPSILKVMQRGSTTLNPASYECLKDIIQVYPYPELFDVFFQHHELSHSYLRKRLPIFLDYCVYTFNDNFIKSKFNQIEKVMLYYLGHSDLICRQVSNLTYACYIARAPSRKEELAKSIKILGIKLTGREPSSEVFRLLIRNSDLSVFDGNSITLSGLSSKLSSSRLSSVTNSTQLKTKSNSITYSKLTHTPIGSPSSVSQSLVLTQKSATTKSPALRHNSFSSTTGSYPSSNNSISTKVNKFIFNSMSDYSHIKPRVDTKSVPLKPRVKKNFLELNKQRASMKKTPGAMPSILEPAGPSSNSSVSANSLPLRKPTLKKSGSASIAKPFSTSSKPVTRLPLPSKRPLLSELLGSGRRVPLSRPSTKSNNSNHPSSTSGLHSVSSVHSPLGLSKPQTEELVSQPAPIIPSNRENITTDSKESTEGKEFDNLQQVYKYPRELYPEMSQKPYSQTSNPAPNSSISSSTQNNIALSPPSQSSNSNFIPPQTMVSNNSSSHGPNAFALSNLNLSTPSTQTTISSHPPLTTPSNDSSGSTFPTRNSTGTVPSLTTQPTVALSVSHQTKRIITSATPSPSKRSRHY